MTRYFAAVLPYITLTKLFGQENREEESGIYWIDKNFEIGMQNTLYASIISFANTVTSVVQQLVIILVGIWLIQDGAIDIGVWIAFYMYANTLNGSFTGIMNMWQDLKRNQGCCARVTAATDAEPEANPGTLEAQGNGDLEFRNVTFAYNEKAVLNEVSFTAPQNKVTAIVGPSGAGKSTILNLVERFYQPGNGEIVWAGKPSTEYDLYSWRRNIGYIPQDTQLFSGTIRDNIAYGVQGEVSDERIRAAAQLADALGFIEAFEYGFDTDVGENGSKLSGGQKQRIAIARALLQDARILILDEATSNLDAESEHAIEQTLKAISKDRTVLMVAHRMDTVKDADQIVVMDHSRVNGIGTHAELMQTNALYRELVTLQSDTVAV